MSKIKQFVGDLGRMSKLITMEKEGRRIHLFEEIQLVDRTKQDLWKLMSPIPTLFISPWFLCYYPLVWGLCPELLPSFLISNSRQKRIMQKRQKQTETAKTILQQDFFSLSNLHSMQVIKHQNHTLADFLKLRDVVKEKRSFRNLDYKTSIQVAKFFGLRYSFLFPRQRSLKETLDLLREHHLKRRQRFKDIDSTQKDREFSEFAETLTIDEAMLFVYAKCFY